MGALETFLRILMIGAIGGIVVTLGQHPELIKNGFDGIDKLYFAAVNPGAAKPS